MTVPGESVARSTTRERHRRLLIVSRDLALLRGHYENVIVNLVRAGVDISIRYVHEQGLSAEEYADTLARRGCSVRLTQLSRHKPTGGDRLALRLRQLGNLLRFSHPDYRGRDWLRDVKFSRAAPGPLRWAVRLDRLGSVVALRVLALTTAVDRLLPAAQSAQSIVAEEQPDLVVAVPVIRTPVFVDYLKAAAARGIATASWVQSWDNLSSKGLLHFVPDRVFVWNATQRDEVARYHRIPGDCVCVTGAQTFDHWFSDEEAPSDRVQVCADYGLDPQRPIILYLASSRQLEPRPEAFFSPWLAAVRASGHPALERASVLARPHPTDVDPWLAFDLDDPNLAISPGTGAAPINSPEFRKRYRNELHHASVAVALNTSGMIDAAIFGKPVCTIELPELSHGQAGTIHFGYLGADAGGMVRTSATFDEHVAVLAELIRRDPYSHDEQGSRFVREFIRPHGLDIPAATVFSDEMLRLLVRASAVKPPGAAATALGRAIHRAGPVLVAPFEKDPLFRYWRPRGLKAFRRRRKKITRRGLKAFRRRRKKITRRLTTFKTHYHRAAHRARGDTATSAASVTPDSASRARCEPSQSQARRSRRLLRR